MEREQRLRSEWVNKPGDARFAEHIAKIDSQNTAWLEKVIEEQGFLGLSDVDGDGVQALFLLIQHSPSLEFQKKCLSYMKRALQQGEADTVHVTYLTDRILMREGKPQRHGTQGSSLEDGVIVPLPIEDEGHINDRRKAIGLEQLEEYLRMMNEMYKTKK